MKISTKGRYALRVMLDLALHEKEGYISLKEIAQRQGISMKYLEMIIGILNKAQAVKSMRGKYGGYCLAGKPSDYTVGFILRLTEGSLIPVGCPECEGGSCDRSGDCLTLPLWKGLGNIISEYLDGITLEDLMRNEKNEKSS